MKKIFVFLFFCSVSIFSGYVKVQAASYNVVDGNGFYNTLYYISSSTDTSNYVYFNNPVISAVGSYSNTLSNENIYFSGNTTIDFNNNYYMLNASNTNLRFSSAITLKNAFKNGDGGVLNIDSSSSEFYGDTVFDKNTAGNGSGGAIYLSNLSHADFYGEAFFTDNSASYSGGGIYLDGSSVEFYSNAYFSGNSADVGGAMFMNLNSTITFSGTAEFSSNTAILAGGAFAGLNSRFYFADANFIGNKAEFEESSGGAVALQDSIISFSGNAVVNLNSSEHFGGAFGLHSSTALFNSASIINNSAGKAGGGIYAEESYISFSGQSSFTGNLASSTSSAGGAFFALNSTVTFSSVTVSANAAAEGGGFYVSSGSNFSFSNTAVFSDNNATDGFGGGFYLSDSASMNFNDTLTVSGNKAVSGGGFYAENDAVISFSNKTLNILNNEASFAGGGIYNGGRAYNFNGNTIVSGNKAAMYGGGLYSHNGGTNKFLSNATFSNNSATLGGAIFLTGKTAVEMKDVVFTSNTAHALGGAVFMQGIGESGYSTLTINTLSSSVFSGNKASGISNAVHIGNYSTLAFNNAAGAAVNMYDNITSGDTQSAFYNYGEGSFYAINNHMSFDYFTNSGNFYMDNASMAVKTQLINNTGAVFNMSGASSVSTAKFENDGKLVFEVHNDETNGSIYASSLKFYANSSLEAEAQNITSDLFREKVYYLINYDILDGTFSSHSVTGLNPSLAITSFIDYGVGHDKWIKLFLKGSLQRTDFQNIMHLSYNGRQTAKAYDKLSGNSYGDLNTVISTIETLSSDAEKKAALKGSSGAFLANVLASPSFDSANSEIYDKINNNYSSDAARNGNGLWVQYSAGKTNIDGNENSSGNYEDTRNGILGGFDKYSEDSGLMLGIFLQYKDHDISQEKNSASIASIGAGLYGGIIKERWEIKALLDGGADSYETKRRIKFSGVNRTAEADFDGFNGGLDIQAALKNHILPDLLFKPYIGMEMKLVNYSGFTEKGADSLNLEIESGNYFRTLARAGMGIGQDKNKYSWQTGFEGKYLLSGEEPEIDLKFAGTDAKFSSRGAEQGQVILGFFAGGSYNIYKNFDIFANASIEASESDDYYYGHIGLRYAFVYPFSGVAERPKTKTKSAKETGNSEEEYQKEIKAAEKAARAAAVKQVKLEQKIKKEAESEEKKRQAEEKKAAERAVKKAEAEQKQRDAELKKQNDEEIKITNEQWLVADQSERKIKEEQDRQEREAIEAARRADIESEKARKAQIEAEIAAFEAQLAAENQKKEAEAEQVHLKQEEAESQAAIEAKRMAEESKAAELAKKQMEEEKLADEKRILVEAKKKEAEEKRVAALVKKEQEEAQKRAALEEKKKAEEEAKAAALAKKQKEEEKLAEEKRILAEAKKKEAEEKRVAALVKKEQEEAQKQAALEEKKKAEEAKAAELAQKQIEEEKLAEERRVLAEAKKKEAEEKRVADLAKKEQEEAQKQADLEIKRKAEEESKAKESAEKQAAAAEKERIKKEAAEIKAREAAREKVRKEEEKAEKLRLREEAAAKKESEKAEYEAAQKIALAEKAAAKKKEDGDDAQKAAKDKTKTVPIIESAVETVKKEKDIKEEPENKETVKLSFVLSQRNLFESSTQFELTQDGIREVWKTADAILIYIESNPGPKYKVLVEGYTDSSGSDEINKQYSLKRAVVVANELADSDINDDIIEPKGFGAANFVNKKNTLSAENRRVEIKLITVE